MYSFLKGLMIILFLTLWFGRCLDFVFVASRFVRSCRGGTFQIVSFTFVLGQVFLRAEAGAWTEIAFVRTLRSVAQSVGVCLGCEKTLLEENQLCNYFIIIENKVNWKLMIQTYFSKVLKCISLNSLNQKLSTQYLLPQPLLWICCERKPTIEVIQ